MHYLTILNDYVNQFIRYRDGNPKRNQWRAK
jgi:hypothetical protein